ncbi:MAG: DUF1850 domain-containing protein, partial [Clostridium sp.]
MKSLPFKISKRTIAAIILFIIAAIFTLTVVSRRGWYLTVRDGDSKAVYARYSVADGDEFSIGFIHSVNKSPLTDIYQIREHKIYVVRTIYYGFGAGVQTEIEDGQTLTYGDKGEMIISGFDREIPHLSYIVGTVSDHVLTIHGKEISLRDLCGRNSTVE